MKIDILDMPRLIEANKLERVRSPRLFSSKTTFDPDGILSNEIFGISKTDRRTTFAYVGLNRRFLHPHIYSDLMKKKSMFKGISSLIAGQKRYTIKNGLLSEDPEGWTGITALYEHWEEIDWSQSSSSNRAGKDILNGLDKNLIFIDRIIVVPPAYRDVLLSGSMDSSDHVNELNDIYQKIIRMNGLLAEGGLFARTQYATQLKVQDTIVESYDYFKRMIKGKNGLIRKYLLGKSVDYGTRAVISAPRYNNERFEDMIVDFEHTAVPISMCLSTFYPFIESWLMSFFQREVVSKADTFRFYEPSTGKEITASIRDPEIQFSDKAVRKMMNDYAMNPDNRFKPIVIEVNKGDQKVDGKPVIAKVGMMITGKCWVTTKAPESVLKRPLTVTDVLYLACVDVCEKRHVMISRYPVGTDKGIIFTKVRVRSTVDHVHALIDGKDYPFYPNIDMKMPHSKVGVAFVDTITYACAHLEGMGADYDGDQISIRGLYTEEANYECEALMQKKMTVLNIDGTNGKCVAKEVFDGMYMLTKDGSGRTLSADEQKAILALSYTDITRGWLADKFATTVDCSRVDRNTKGFRLIWETFDRITVPANYFYKGQAEMSTTVGRFIFSKFILEGAGIISAVGYVNDTVGKKGLGIVDQLVGRLYMEDTINRAQFNAYIDRRDCLGYWLCGMICNSISEKFSKPLPEVEKKKAELLKKYEKELAAKDVDVMTKIDKELIEVAKEALKDDPGMELYTSGDLDFGNNYKNNSIVKGAVLNKITGEFDYISASFMDGVEIENIPAYANSILASQYPASIATKDAGYASKKLISLLQMMEVDEEGTDCGTKQTIPIRVTKTNLNMLEYTNIVEGGQLKTLTPGNLKSYIGKTIRARSPMTCTTPKICSVCAGKMFHMLGAEQAGLFAVQLSHADLNLGLKAKHNSVVELSTINPDELIVDI